LDKDGIVACSAESFVPVQNPFDTFGILAIWVPKHPELVLE
jgi:hypothetical protein